MRAKKPQPCESIPTVMVPFACALHEVVCERVNAVREQMYISSTHTHTLRLAVQDNFVHDVHPKNVISEAHRMCL